MSSNILYWTYERCQKEAKKFKSRGEWQINSSSSYQAAFKYKWLDKLAYHMGPKQKHKGYWTKEQCLKEARKYKTIKTWRKNSKSSLDIAYRNGWYKECIKYMKPYFNSWTLKECKEDALKYKTRGKWAKNSCKYQYARKYGWLEECCKNFQ